MRLVPTAGASASPEAAGLVGTVVRTPAGRRRTAIEIARSAIIVEYWCCSIFTPAAPGQRSDLLGRLSAMGQQGGRGPALRRELCQRLDRGDLAAVTGYHEAYDHSLCDEDLADLFEEISFASGATYSLKWDVPGNPGMNGHATNLPDDFPKNR